MRNVLLFLSFLIGFQGVIFSQERTDEELRELINKDCNYYFTKKEVKIILSYVDESLFTKAEKTEIISDLVFKSLFYNTKVFLKEANKLENKNVLVLLKIIETPLSDRIKNEELILKIKKTKYNKIIKQSILEQLEKK